MDENKIDELRGQADAIYSQMVALKKAAKASFLAFVKKLTNENVVVYTHASYDWGFNVSISEDGGDKPIFGTDIDVRYDEYFYKEEKRIYFNTGSCGAFSTDNKGQVAKYRLLSALIEHAKGFKVMAEEFEAKYYPLWKKYADIDREIQKLEDEARYNAVMSKVEPGAWFAGKPDRRRSFLIVKKTKKMVFFREYRFNWASSRWERRPASGDKALSHQAFVSEVRYQRMERQELPEGINL